MLSALLPGVREVRTPLVAGLLWAASFWVAFGPWIAKSEATKSFVRGLGLFGIPSGYWFASATLVAYLIGSLLVVRSSPFGGRGRHWKYIARERVDWMTNRESELFAERLLADDESIDDKLVDVDDLEDDELGDDEGEPGLESEEAFPDDWDEGDVEPGWTWRLQSKIWRRVPEFLKRYVHRWVYDEVPNAPLEMWARNKFDAYAEAGSVPLMKAFAGGVMGPRGFDAFYKPDSLPDETWASGWGDLGGQFLDEIRSEKSAVEVRIQMRYPEVYAEVDRLKSEGEIRLSIFWPTTVLLAVLAWAWSPLILVALIVPPFLLRDGFRRTKESEEKVWAALLSGEVTSPALDAMYAAHESGTVLDFAAKYPDYSGQELSSPQ